MGRLKMARKGLTLIELVFASTLSLSLLLAILSLQSSVMRAESREYQSRKLAADSLYCLSAMQRDLRSASVVVEPAVDGAPVQRLLAYVNVHPADMAARIVSGEPQRYFLYCFENESGTMYKYSGDYPPGLRFDPFKCGCAPSAGQTKDTIVSGLKNSLVSYSFVRLPQNSNSVNIIYRIASRDEEVKGSTAVSLQKSL